jgi:hypothetical protein
MDVYGELVECVLHVDAKAINDIVKVFQYVADECYESYIHLYCTVVSHQLVTCYIRSENFIIYFIIYTQNYLFYYYNFFLIWCSLVCDIL